MSARERRGRGAALRAAVLLGALLLLPAHVRATQAARAGLDSWWNGSALTAPESGPNRALRAQGVDLSGHYAGALFGILRSDSGGASPYDEGVQFNLDLEAARLLGWRSLEGLVLTGEGRWREPSPSADPNTFVRGNSMFDPSNWASGTSWRLLQASAAYTNALGGSIADRLWLKAGWVQPRYEFALQPMTDRVLNNAVNSAKGIGGNIPFSSSFSTWGAMARLRGAELYAKAGVFMSYPDATASENHGVQFGGSPPRNGVMGMAEVGFTPSLEGARLSSTSRPSRRADALPVRSGGRLPGRYVIGAYLYDNANDRSSADGNPNYGLQSGVYLLADQLLYSEGIADEASGSGAAQGLTGFGLLMLAPARNNEFQLYLHTGLGYTGALPRRDRDAVVLVLAYGNYSRSSRSETVFVEGGYHIQLNPWLDLYPFLQVEVRPAGTSDVANAVLLGFATTVLF